MSVGTKRCWTGILGTGVSMIMHAPALHPCSGGLACCNQPQSYWQHTPDQDTLRLLRCVYTRYRICISHCILLYLYL
jgi:hypothetical protein